MKHRYKGEKNALFTKIAATGLWSGMSKMGDLFSNLIHKNAEN